MIKAHLPLSQDKQAPGVDKTLVGSHLEKNLMQARLPRRSVCDLERLTLNSELPHAPAVSRGETRRYRGS